MRRDKSLQLTSLLRGAIGACWLIASSSVLAQTSPTRLYEGTAGGRPIELITVANSRESISGYVFEKSTGQLSELEESPHLPGATAIIDVLDKPGTIPVAAISFHPFKVTDAALSGDWIELRTRSKQPVDLRQTVVFDPDSSEAVDGTILQVSGDAPFVFRVHAHRAKGEYGAIADRIDIYDRATGRLVQQIDHLILSFAGVKTLTFADFNGDRQMDFSASRMAVDKNGNRSTGVHMYYLFLDGRFQNFAALDELESSGAVTFPASGQVEMRPEIKVDYSRRVETWNRYRFTAPDKLQFIDSQERPFS
ncbi:hypothetical protein [Paraburkholderia sp. C35]|uniref:hypothetical protein n=1 Tax=Paraburkholderia sp. C35 TaxID=2126993 RepID=UPI0013A5B6D0|nr:hypothetical protein [Paraburkholderia sp. C35]